jgi:hypothetical protein
LHPNGAKKRSAEKYEPCHFAFSSDVIGDCGARRDLVINTERDLVEYAIAFAHDATKRSAFRGWLRRQPDAEEGSIEQIARHVSFTSDEEIARQRREIIKLCAALVDNDATQIASIAEDVIERARALPVNADLQRPSPTSVTFRTYVMLHTVSDLCTYVFTLLLDDTCPYRDDLRQCQLDTCGRFFLVQRAANGRPRAKYHGERCMQRAHELGSAQRTQNSRAQKAATRRKHK